MDFYQPDNLEAIYGVGNPEAYIQGRQQVNMSNLFQDQALQQQQAETQKRTLANQFDAENNPLRIQAQQLENTGRGYKNDVASVDARSALAMEGIKIDAAKRKAILSATDDDIKGMQQQAQQMLYSLDPAVQEKGRKLTLLSQASIEARQKHAEELEKVKMQRDSAEKIAAGNNAATLGAARIGADSRRDVASTRAAAKSPQEVAAKLGYEKGAVYYQIKAEDETDPELKAQYEALAARFGQENIKSRSATNQGKVDITGATGMPTQSVNTGMGSKPALGTAENPIVLK